MDAGYREALRALSLVADIVPVPGLNLILSIMASAITPVRWDDMKALVSNLKSEATIATFLAAVQAQIIALSYLNNSSRIEVATNAFGFMGVMFDVIAALLALFSSTIMQTRVAVIDRILTNAARLNPDQLTSFLRYLGSRGGQKPIFVRAMIKDIAEPMLGRAISAAQRATKGQDDTNQFTPDTDHHFDTEANASQVIKSCGDIDGIRVFGDAAGASMLFGILSFMASIVCFAVATQPVAVFVPTVVACSCVIVLPLANKALALIGFRLPSVFDV